jgi:protein SCO1/2
MNKKNSNNKFIKGLAVALLLPLAFFIYYQVKVQRSVSKKIISLPAYYGVDTVINGDTVYHKVDELILTNQLGQLVSLNKDLKGKIVVVNFFFTTCPTVCPKLTNNMTLLQKAFRKDPKRESSLQNTVHLVSITVDPAKDSFQALRTYADGYHVNHDNWWFMTGDRNAIYNYARHELKVVMAPTTGGAEDFIHTQKVVVLDTARHIRGYYDGLNEKEMKKCADDIVLLTLEKRPKK